VRHRNGPPGLLHMLAMDIIVVDTARTYWNHESDGREPMVWFVIGVLVLLVLISGLAGIAGIMILVCNIGNKLEEVKKEVRKLDEENGLLVKENLEKTNKMEVIPL
jgi:hypothetical protein